MPEFEDPHDRDRMFAYLREQLGFSENAIHQITPIIHSVGMIDTVRKIASENLQIGAWRSKPWRLFYGYGAHQIAFVHSGGSEEIHLPLELLLKTIVLACRLTEGIKLLSEPIEWQQEIHARAWDVHADVLPATTANFLHGVGHLLSVFTNFDGTASIDSLAAEARQLLEKTLSWGGDTQHLLRPIAVGCFTFIYAHECAHLLRQHVTFRPQLLQLEKDDPQKHLRIRNALECEADIHAFSFLPHIGRAQIVKFADTSEGVFDPGSFFPDRTITDRTFLGLTAFSIMVLRSFWIFTHQGRGETMSSLFIRNYLVANAEYSQQERRIIQIQPDYTDEEWLHGYSLARRALQVLISSTLAREAGPLASDIAIPPFCLINSDSTMWRLHPTHEDSWAILDEADRWVARALNDLAGNTPTGTNDNCGE
jgi:hypothetical protein